MKVSKIKLVKEPEQIGDAIYDIIDSDGFTYLNMRVPYEVYKSGPDKVIKFIEERGKRTGKTFTKDVQTYLDEQEKKR